MIDAQGFRANVAIVLINQHGKVFWGKRVGQSSWQFPQGGIAEGEMPLAAMYRELREEIGLLPHQVELLAVTRHWLHYHLPKHMVRRDSPRCIGQKQKWFLLRLRAPEEAIHFDETGKPEFDGWRWVDFWYPTKHVVSFKRPIYVKALRFLQPRMQRLLRQEQSARRKKNIA